MFFPPIERNDIWQMGHNILARIEINSSILIFKNIRNIDYKNQLENYYDEDFDLDNLEDIYMISTPFGFKNIMSHIMLEFSFRNNQKIVLSVEARRQNGEDFSSLKGLMRHFGLIFIWGNVEDLIGLRKDIRKSKVYRYRLNLSENEKKEGLLYFVDRTNKLAIYPEYYNTFLSNCTTNLWNAFKLKETQNRPKFTKEVFFSGFLDKYLYKIGLINNSLPFVQTKNNSLL